MPEITLTGWKRRIAEFCDERGIEKSAGQIERMALKIAKRAARMQDVDPDDLIRSILDYKDPTGEEALIHVAATGACRFCGKVFADAETVAS